MKRQFVIFSMVLFLGGLLIVPNVNADSAALRWKAPRVNSKESSSTPALLSESETSSKAGPIQQVRYLAPNGERPIEVGGGIPAATGQVDTMYPETRLSTPQPAIPLRGSGSSPPLFDETTWDEEQMSNFVPSQSRVRPPLIQMQCPDTNTLKSLRDIDYSIKLKDPGQGPQECELGETYFQQRNWNRICFMWKASALAHNPTYFEDDALERYGHTFVREEFQPLVSGARFFLTIPILPYKMGINPPNECIYALGYYRPGSCAPYMLDPLPISVRGGLLQAGTVVGGVAIFP